MNKKEFCDKYHCLSMDYYSNYNEMEKLTKRQIEDEGLDCFKGMEHMLGRFESTLPQFFTACENNLQNIHRIILVILLLSYLHLDENKKAKRIRKILKERGYDEDFPTHLYGVDDFQPSTDISHGKVITAKYDKRIDDLGKFLIADFDKVENFIQKEWGNQIPNNIYINLVDSVGPSPFNSLLNCEVYFKVGHYIKSKFNRDIFSSYVVHEIMHFHENAYLRRIFPKSDEQGSYKFIDEGYAEWKRTEYLKKHSEYKVYTDNCAYHMLGSNLLELSDLKDKWFKVMFDFLNCPIYETATSFTYFLEDKLGYDRINKIFDAIPDYLEAKTWTDYLKSYLEKDLIDLMTEWKNAILKNKGSRESISEEIITHFQHENTDEDKTIFHYKSKYPLWAGHNIFIYDDNMKLQPIDKVEKYRFLKEGRLIMKTVKSEKFTVFVHFYQYGQKFEYKLL